MKAPTTEEINALPEHIKDYIHELIASEPGSVVQDLAMSRDNSAGLLERVKELAGKIGGSYNRGRMDGLYSLANYCDAMRRLWPKAEGNQSPEFHRGFTAGMERAAEEARKSAAQETETPKAESDEHPE